jgi:hypothetical protein
VDPSTGEVYGYTLPDAVYRTNHGYDPVTQENYQVPVPTTHHTSVVG